MRFTLLLSYFVLFSSTLLYGQLTKSNWLFTTEIYSTGGAYFENNAGPESNLASIELNYASAFTIFVFNVAPSAGYFVTDRWVLGTGAIFNTTIASGTANELLILRPFVRHYWNPQAEKRFFFTELSYNRIASLRDDSFDSSGAALYGGMSYRLTESVILDGRLGYTIQNLGLPQERTGDIALNATLNMLLGASTRTQDEVRIPIRRGTWITGVSDLSFAGWKRDFGIDRSFALYPKLLYFVSDRWALGAGLAYNWERRRFRSSDIDGPFVGKIKDRIVSISPQARYYLLKARNYAIFANAGLEIRRELTTADKQTTFLFIGEDKLVTKRQNITLGFGANLFLTKNFALEFGPSWRYDYDLESGRVGLDMGWQIFFGGKE